LSFFDVSDPVSYSQLTALSFAKAATGIPYESIDHLDTQADRTF